MICHPVVHDEDSDTDARNHVARNNHVVEQGPDLRVVEHAGPREEPGGQTGPIFLAGIGVMYY